MDAGTGSVSLPMHVLRSIVNDDFQSTEIKCAVVQENKWCSRLPLTGHFLSLPDTLQTSLGIYLSSILQLLTMSLTRSEPSCRHRS